MVAAVSTAIRGGISKWWKITGSLVYFIWPQPTCVPSCLLINVVVFWVVMSCSAVVRYQHFRGPFCLHHRGKVSSP
jgi:hypothetical protein